MQPRRHDDVTAQAMTSVTDTEIFTLNYVHAGGWMMTSSLGVGGSGVSEKLVTDTRRQQ